MILQKYRKIINLVYNHPLEGNRKKGIIRNRKEILVKICKSKTVKNNQKEGPPSY